MLDELSHSMHTTRAPQVKNALGSSVYDVDHVGDMDDIQLARAIAQQVELVPGVHGLHPGQYALVATYGVHDRLAGIAFYLDHECGGAHYEIHVTVDAVVMSLPISSEDTPSLALLADHIRNVVQGTLHELRLPPAACIDVTLGDIA